MRYHLGECPTHGLTTFGPVQKDGISQVCCLKCAFQDEDEERSRWAKPVEAPDVR